MDILNLARMNKAFREVLMSRANASIWVAARRNIKGLPKCPPFLSEPAYANLCFGIHCHVRLAITQSILYLLISSASDLLGVSRPTASLLAGQSQMVP